MIYTHLATLPTSTLYPENTGGAEMVRSDGTPGTHCPPPAARETPSGSALHCVFRCPTDADKRAQLALAIDQAMREMAPAGWKGDETRERQVQNALFPIMSRDRRATLAIFEIIKHQPGY